MTASFVHLRMHTEYSVTDGMVRIDPVLEATKKDGGIALGITDTMNVFGGLRFYTHALKAGIKPVLGCDLLIQNPKDTNKPFLLTVFCQNHEGYHTLCVLLTKAFLEEEGENRGKINQAWFDSIGTEGLIAMTGGPRGEIGHYFASGLKEEARKTIEVLARRFPNRLYLELQRVGRQGDESLVRFLANEGARASIPVVATHPVQFLEKSNFEAHEVRCCIADGYVLADPNRPKIYTPEQYLKSIEEMQALFADIPSALANSVEIAKRCNLDGVLSKPQLPIFPTPEGLSAGDYLDRLSREGLEKRLAFLYPDEAERNQKRPQYVERLDYEINTIKTMDFPGYFLIVQDFINWSKTHGVPVGPGRGSGAGSLVAYSLGITNLDPLKFDLLFERFLNPERVSMPDFDIDFCQYNRDRTIEYVKATYGVDAVSQIATYGTMGAKGVVRDVGRVLDMPYMKVDGLSKLIPQQPGKLITLEDALQESVEFKEAIDAQEDFQELMRLAKPLEGLTRNLGMHAGGVLIAPGKLTDFCPLYNSDGAPENTVSQYDKKDIESVGLVKFDFLGLTTLSILAKADEYIKKLDPTSDFDIERIPIDDAPTYELFQKGKTTAIFQFESEGMRQLLIQAQPDRLEDLVALNALYRPGPMDLIPSFIARKFGREAVEYLDQRMEPVLKETYGIMVYQEQVMRVAQVVGGYSLGGADLLRRAMGKKNVEEMHRQRAVFIEGAAERGVEAKAASEIFDLMEKFAGYGFNKSHAAAYSYVAYQTAYLKAHHPAAFMAANMCMVMDQAEKVKALVDDAHSMGLSVLPPDVNESEWFFTVPDEKTIRFGLGAIKGVGQAVIEALQAERANGAYLDLFDVAERVPGMNSRVLDGLVRAGAFDSQDTNRGKLCTNVSQALSAAQAKASVAGQDSLFAAFGEETRIVSWKEASPWTKAKQLSEEKAVIGFWLSGHLFDEYREELKQFTRNTLASLSASKDIQRYCGVVTSIRKIQSKRGLIAIVALDDGTAEIEVVFFSTLWLEVKDKVQEDEILCIEGKVRFEEHMSRMSYGAETVKTLGEWRAQSSKVCVLVDEEKEAEVLALIKENVSANGEGVQVVLDVHGKETRGEILLDVHCRTDLSEILKSKGIKTLISM